MDWLEIETTAGPAIEPITLAEAKAQCRVRSASEDELIEGLIATSRRLVERLTGLRLITQTVVMRASRFCGRAIRLPCAPLQAIGSISYVDSAGSAQTLSASLYREQLVGLTPRFELLPSESWPETLCVEDAVTITATAGFGDVASDVPQDVLHAIKLIVAHLHVNREGGELPPAITMLLRNFRV